MYRNDWFTVYSTGDYYYPVKREKKLINKGPGIDKNGIYCDAIWVEEENYDTYWNEVALYA